MNLRRRLQNYIALNNYVEAFRSNVLPDEYTQLEYITGDGNAYIDLGLPLTQDDSIEIDFIARYTTGAQIFGYRDSASSNNIMLLTGSGTNSIFLDFNNSDYAPYRLSTTTVNGSEYKAISNKNLRQFLDSNGDVITENTTACPDTITIGNVYLFFANGSPSGNNKFTGSIKKVIISDRMYLIPAKRNSDNVVGMFDLVSNKFFTNANDVGNFIAGPNASKTVLGNKVYLEDSIKDSLSSLNVYGKAIQSNIPEGYTQLEYIESSGTQYIDTGILLSNTDVFEITFQSLNSLESPIMGAISGGTSYTSTNNLSVTYTVASGLSAYAVYCDGAAGDANHAWNSGNRGDGLKHTIKYNGLNIAPTLDGVDMEQLVPTTLTTNTPTVTTWLFGRNNTSSGTKTQTGVRIYDVYIQGKGHFIPTKRNSDNVIGMYDTVSGQFFTNADTGNFIAGPEIVPTPTNSIDIYCNNGKLVFGDPDVPSEYKRLLDIIFDGDIYYVTNTYLTGADTTTFTINATNDGRNILGCYTGSGSGNNISFYLSTGSSGNYVRYKNSLYRPILGGSKLNTDLTLSIGPTGTTGFDTDATWTELEFVSPDAFYIGWLANASSPKFKGSFIGNITVSNHANFIPCERVSDSAIGYYDTYSNTFFEKQGTGTPTTSGYDYSHYTVIAEGTPEKLNIKGNNLYDITKDITGKFIGENGSIGDEPYSCYSDLIPVKEGESYTYSGMCNVGSASNANNKRIHGYVNDVWNQQIAVISVNKNNPFSNTFTIPAGINGIRISHWTDDSNTQVEECYRPTKYNNYIDMNLDVANLLSVGDYIDSQDILNGSIIRNVGVKVLKGTENWSRGSNTDASGNRVFYLDFLDKKIGNGLPMLSTHFSYKGSASYITLVSGDFLSNASNTNVYFDGNGITTTSDWKQWLVNQYNAGTPVIIIYPLATPTTETVTSQTTLLSSNNNVITRDSEYIDDLGLDLTYKKLR